MRKIITLVLIIPLLVIFHKKGPAYLLVFRSLVKGLGGFLMDLA